MTSGRARHTESESGTQKEREMRWGQIILLGVN
jgi:hypothetical protein